MMQQQDHIGVAPTWGNDRAKYGPQYPNLGTTVEKTRRAINSNGGIRQSPRSLVVAHAREIEKAILRLQRSEIMRALPPNPRPNCASGTTHTRGEDIAKAVRARQNAALLACPGMQRRARKDEDWRTMYVDAMVEKRRAETAAERKAIEDRIDKMAA